MSPELSIATRWLNSLNPGKMASSSPFGRDIDLGHGKFFFDLFILVKLIRIPGDRLF